jgi:hypothetical protein
MLSESRGRVTIARGSVTPALTLGLRDTFVFSVPGCGMPKPFDPGGAGIVTVGASNFLSTVWALHVCSGLKTTSIDIKRNIFFTRIALFTIVST